MTTTELVPNYLDVTKMAIASFLARYREPTLTAYTQDLKTYLAWCGDHRVPVLRVTRGGLEMYVRHLEGRGMRRRRSPAASARWPPSTSTR